MNLGISPFDPRLAPFLERPSCGARSLENIEGNLVRHTLQHLGILQNMISYKK